MATPVFPLVNTRDPEAVLAAVLPRVEPLLDPGGLVAVRATFGWLLDTFAGRNPAFEALDTQYHDVEHTMQGFLCLGHMLAGWHLACTAPALDSRTARLALVAMLLHDTGYLKERGDTAGTGARFTPVHVERGTRVARALLTAAGWTAADTAAVEAMIRCTGPKAVPAQLPFESAAHRRAGCAVGTADLLGQMAAPDYLEKLPLLYREFAEASAFHPGGELARLFPDLAALLRQTPAFWEQHVLGKLDRALEGVHACLADPWPSGPNRYLLQIEANIARLRAQLASRVTPLDVER